MCKCREHTSGQLTLHISGQPDNMEAIPNRGFVGINSLHRLCGGGSSKLTPLPWSVSRFKHTNGVHRLWWTHGTFSRRWFFFFYGPQHGTESLLSLFILCVHNKSKTESRYSMCIYSTQYYKSEIHILYKVFYFSTTITLFKKYTVYNILMNLEVSMEMWNSGPGAKSGLQCIYIWPTSSKYRSYILAVFVVLMMYVLCYCRYILFFVVGLWKLMCL